MILTQLGSKLVLNDREAMMTTNDRKTLLNANINVNGNIIFNDNINDLGRCRTGSHWSRSSEQRRRRAAQWRGLRHSMGKLHLLIIMMIMCDNTGQESESDQDSATVWENSTSWSWYWSFGMKTVICTGWWVWSLKWKRWSLIITIR